MCGAMMEFNHPKTESCHNVNLAKDKTGILVFVLHGYSWLIYYWML